jgi:hypothetical protein
MRKVVLTFGLIAGAILSAMMAITLPFHDQTGFDRALVVGYTSMVLAFLMVFFGARSYRDNVAGGSVSFWRAFQVGFLIALVGMVCYGAMWEVMYHNFYPDYLDKYTAYAIGKLQQSGASAAEIAAETQKMAQMKAMYQNPLLNVLMTMLEPLPVGLVASLISAGILSRKRRLTDGALAGAR